MVYYVLYPECFKHERGYCFRTPFVFGNWEGRAIGVYSLEKEPQVLNDLRDTGGYINIGTFIVAYYWNIGWDFALHQESQRERFLGYHLRSFPLKAAGVLDMFVLKRKSYGYYELHIKIF